MEPVKFSHIQVFTSSWLPFGRSNMEALNRFVGSHKKYTAATEFGVDGVIGNMNRGSINMKSHGVFLTPVDYDYTGFLKATLARDNSSENQFGVHFTKEGLTTLGITVDDAEQLYSDEIKILSGKLNHHFSTSVLPLLTDVQQSLLAGIFQVQTAKEIGYKLHSYSLIKASVEDDLNQHTGQFLKDHYADVASITDWITHQLSLDGCKIYIGMAACLCVGETNEKVDQFLNQILYLNTCRITAQRLHSLLWSLRRQIQQYRKNIARGSYKLLKKTNDQICSTNDTLSKVRVFDQMLRDETRSVFEEVKNAGWMSDTDLGANIIHEFQYEIEKSENRDIMLEQLSEEVEVLSSDLENRLELIMTKDNMQLNLILLILTIISILGVAEVLDFSKEQWEVVAAFVIPFGLFVIYYIYNFLRNFQLRESDLNNKP